MIRKIIIVSRAALKVLRGLWLPLSAGKNEKMIRDLLALICFVLNFTIGFRVENLNP